MSDIETNGAGEIILGRGGSIGRGVTAHFAAPGRITIGDYVALGDNVRLVVSGGDVEIGDWTTLHPDCLVMSTQGVSIGAHCWFGQNCVIDGTGGLTIGDGVRVGMFSQLWTHVAAGEQIEGCTLFGATPSVIEQDVWLVGTCTVGSGVTVGARTVALAGSNITKSCPPNSTLAGAPAKVKEGISFYREVSLAEKFEMLRGWLVAYAAGAPADSARIIANDDALTVEHSSGASVVFYRTVAGFEAARMSPDGSVTLCCVENKKYVKVFTAAEKDVLKYLEGNKARFYS